MFLSRREENSAHAHSKSLGSSEIFLKAIWRVGRNEGIESAKWMAIPQVSEVWIRRYVVALNLSGSIADDREQAPFARQIRERLQVSRLKLDARPRDQIFDSV